MCATLFLLSSSVLILCAAASVSTIGAFRSLGAALLATAASNDKLGCTINSYDDCLLQLHAKSDPKGHITCFQLHYQREVCNRQLDHSSEPDRKKRIYVTSLSGYNYRVVCKFSVLEIKV